MVAADSTAFAVRGVIEGFYGPVWPWAARLRLVDFLAGHGMNTYAYAPKNDPLHRDRWREPYLPEEWDRFGELNRRCAAAGIDFVFGVSPLGFGFDGADEAALADKITAADAAGIRHFCLLVDDMPDRVDPSGQPGADPAQGPADADVRLVALVHDVVRGLGGDRQLWFVPQPYCGDTDTGYLRQLGRDVPADVQICWTGPQVCSAQVTSDHMGQVRAVLRRPPLLWDNHPVNDGGMQFDPHLGPLRGRDPRLPETTAGIVANLALQPEASRIAVATVAAYAADPQSYEPETAWAQALRTVTGDGDDAAAVAALADLARRSPLEPGRRDTPVTAAVTDFWRRWAAGERDRAMTDLDAQLGALGDHADRLTRLHNAHLAGDLLPWSAKLAHLVAAARGGLQVLRRAAGAGSGDHRDRSATTPDLRREVLASLERAQATMHWVSGDDLESFARRCLRVAADEDHAAG